MLKLEGVSGGYGAVQVLRGFSLEVPPGQVTCLMGRNGAGKTSALRAIMGQLRLSAGSITLNGQALHSLPAEEVPKTGIGYVPQGRRLFGPLSVQENLTIGLMTRRRGADQLERVLTLFPRLRERLTQRASTLSGGEQQMLAIGRALCLEPSVLLLDEPSEGLQPSMVALIRETVLRLKAEGVATLLVEQRAETVLALADQVAFVSAGAVAEVFARESLTKDHPAFGRWVGI
ncbi:ABC transporter ATP-binding protein [Falsigemmobacter faecalis]|uniref:ABC transporter ATP-binding protein n=1 Tax=Falsigemmobacter faecalis TaxID=2488730 RepID=A0A3P3DUI1_9RHOB|nr:ABC transporter ATP-binding protein [Falsigemmobacter faecalis]RRH77947.1 ABC transporter ATP-binding protein [Falsigemmobacter faecalis]